MNTHTTVRRRSGWERALLGFQVCALVVTAALIGTKVFLWGYSFEKMIPETVYTLQIAMSFDASNEAVRISAFLPQNDTRQEILDEKQTTGGLKQTVVYSDSGRASTWEGVPPAGTSARIVYEATVHTQAVVYDLAGNIQKRESYPSGFEQHLQTTPTIQTNHPTIEAMYRRYVPDTGGAEAVLRAIYAYTAGLGSVPFKGLTDAVTAARLGEASCNGKSRLFAALSRRAGIPCRLVGGVILNAGTKRTSHQWVEAYVGRYWVPFDPHNRHFASIPENYLVLYRGDQFVFSHTPGIRFDYAFKIRKGLEVSAAFQRELQAHPLNAYKAWRVFEELGIPLSLLKIIIMIPLGAFIISIFRNVVGLETFGTFLPALLAAASRETGLAWGLVGFALVVIVVSLAHYPLERWRILHNPKMGILMIVVVTALLSFAVVGSAINLTDLSYVSLFPIAILTITSERFAQMLVERGPGKAGRVMIMTLLVIACAYWAMNSLAMQSLFLAFPELYLVLIVLNLWLGRWIGLRVTEFWRFRRLMRPQVDQRRL